MKSQKLLQFLLLFTAALFFTCSSSDDGESGGSGSATSITITSPNSTVMLGGTFIFIVKDNNGNTVTSGSTIYFDDVAITGSTYSPVSGGVFTVNAEYDGLVSNDLSVTVTDPGPVTSIVLARNKSEVALGDEVTMSVVGNNGVNLTGESTYFVNGTEIVGNSYVTTSYGIDVLTATHETFESAEKTVLVGYTKKVLVEDYTGAWCGWCPRVAYGIELVEDDTDDAVVVAIHRGSAAAGGNHDPYNFPADELEDFVNLSGYPTARLNRIVEWTYPEPNNVEQVLNLNGISAAGLAINSSSAGGNLNVSVKVDMITGDVSDLKLVVYVLEDDLFYNQTNYTDYYGGVSTISNFEHDNVLRQTPTGVFGETVLASDMDSTSGYYEKDYNFAISADVENANNLSVVAFLVDANGLAVNSQEAAVGVNGDFE